jgi:hypothetical protein
MQLDDLHLLAARHSFSDVHLPSGLDKLDTHPLPGSPAQRSSALSSTIEVVPPGAAANLFGAGGKDARVHLVRERRDHEQKASPNFASGRG